MFLTPNNELNLFINQMVFQTIKNVYKTSSGFLTMIKYVLTFLDTMMNKKRRKMLVDEYIFLY